MLLQPKLNMKVSQRQVLTPGLVQMVSVLALNKLELKEMINTEMVENPVLEELEESGVTLDERAGMEGDRERSAEEVVAESDRVEKDPFDEIDFGSYFQDFLDPGFKTASSNFEEYDKPSFENFLSQPSTLSDHLAWQLGSMTLTPEVRAAAELVVGNLSETGYLTATDEELASALLQYNSPTMPEPIPFERGTKNNVSPIWVERRETDEEAKDETDATLKATVDMAAAADDGLTWAMAAVVRARKIVNYLDPVGVGARDLKECLLIQICAQQREAAIVLGRRKKKASNNGVDGCEDLEQMRAVSAGEADVFSTAIHIVSNCLPLLQKKDMRELTRSCGRSAEAVQEAVEYIRTLDPRPGRPAGDSDFDLMLNRHCEAG